ncbi:MAG TPA: DJ-1/PfpI family protein [Ensifer sp.]|nr:DJ-1/PfpI family protein [Ensifer sp.]
MHSRKIVILAFPGVALLDIVGPSDVFAIATQYTLPTGHIPYEITVASQTGGPVRSSSGLELLTQKLSDIDPAEIDTVLVSGGGPPMTPPIPEYLVGWLKQNSDEVRRICGVCTGTFLLAAAGLADKRRVTTHWEATELLQQLYPQANVEIDPIFVKDGRLWSSAGLSAGIDLSIALIEEDHGHAAAMRLARLLVMFVKRPGHQAQYSAPLALQAGADEDFSNLHAWIADHLWENLTIERLASQARLSPRTFMRRYKLSVGRTPGRTVKVIRLEAACREILETQHSLKQIAKSTGFGDEQTLRRAFIEEYGMPPQQVRDRHARGVANL